MTPSRMPPILRHLVSLAARLAVFTLLWWAMTEGDPTTWTYAVVVVPAAVATSYALLPHRLRSPGAGWARRAWALTRLCGWFLWRSLLGGTDVARRALGRQVELNPGFVRCPMRLPPGAGRVVVADLMNLMPGSLSVHLDQGRAGRDTLVLHVLDLDMAIPQTVAELEEQVAIVGALALTPDDDAGERSDRQGA